MVYAMTIEHLLTNTAGLASRFFDHPVDSLYRRAGLETADITLAEFSDSIAKLPLKSSPGDAWSYSPAMEVVSRIIELVSGRNIDQYFNEEIFAPLGMQETSFYLVPEMEGRIPISYSLDDDGKLNPAPQFLDPRYLPTSRLTSYGVLTTMVDFLRFAQMMLNGGELDGNRVLSRASVAAMMSNRISPALTPIVTPVFDHTGYGFGLGGAVLVDSTIAKYPASPGTYRWAGGTGTFIWIDPKLGLSAILLFQSKGIGYQAEHTFEQALYDVLQP